MLRITGRFLRPQRLILFFRALRLSNHATAQYRDLTLDVVDLREPSRRNVAALVAAGTEALKRLSVANQGLGELVTSHLRRIVALPTENMGNTWATMWQKRAYISSFEGPDSRNGHYLAFLLVGSATATRLRHDALGSSAPLTEDAVQRSAWEVQKRFLEQFEDAEKWILRMRPPGLDEPFSQLPPS